MRKKRVVPATSPRHRAAIAFGTALRFARAQTGISQLSLAALSGLDPSYVSLLERGQRVPSFIVIIRLADALEMNSIRLFAEGVAGLSGGPIVEVQAMYRLAYQAMDGQFIEVEGHFSSVEVAASTAVLENIGRRKFGAAEFTHIVEYVRAGTIEINMSGP